MNVTRLALMGGAAAASLLLSQSFAVAQTTTPPVGQTASADAAPTTGKDVQEVVVTGSRIARRDYVSESPISTVSAQALRDTGIVTVGEALQQMPQVSAGAGATNSDIASFGNGGRSTVDLRGLGAQRTLVLVDGRRAQPSDGLNSIDLNTIPQFMVANVEIITGGASAVYGSDA
ncbi:MAG: TonB-dependent receptor plug domain-containing protein, partial [Caulobacteraceae bacterium]|nr:TonB-dependent receptor plug domain-containing protein [Caulobacteraceae bacterium]